MLDNTKNNGIFEMIENTRTFESASIKKIKIHFFAAKIIKTARSVIMKLSRNIFIKKCIKMYMLGILTIDKLAIQSLIRIKWFIN